MRIRRFRFDIEKNETVVEYIEVPDSYDGREVHRGELPYGEQTVQGRRSGVAYSRPWRSKSLGVPYYQAKQFSEAADRERTGAYYDQKTGEMVCDSRETRNRELLRRGFGDGSGGYGDVTPDVSSKRAIERRENS